MKYVLLLLFFSATRLAAQTGNDSVFNENRLVSFALTDPAVNKSAHVNAGSGKSKPRLFLFLSPDCPICRGYSPELNRLVSLYRNDTEIYGIIPGKTYSDAAIDSFARQFRIGYRLLSDKTLGLSRYLRASVTPEAILLNGHNELLYKGAIDDGVIGLGKSGARTTRHYLADALDAAQKNQTAPTKRTRAVGCILNDY